MILNRKKILILFLLIFTIAFPKSGIVAGGVPLNTIYILMFSLFPWAVIIRLHQDSSSQHDRLYGLYIVLLIPFWLLLLVITTVNGIQKIPVYMGYLIALIIVPIFFFLIHNVIVGSYKNFFLTTLKLTIRFAALFGLILFLYKIVTHEYFTIPMLTTTYGADITLEARMNDRGGIYKLFSTYNNGNIYAICMLMLLPVFNLIEKQKIWVFIVILSIMLTLSRTAWALLFLYWILEYFILSKKVSIKKLMLIATGLIVFIPSIVLLLNFIGRDVDFLFDSNLGGRVAYLDYFYKAEFISSTPLYWSYEIPYVSIAEFIGLIGLLPFLMYFSHIFLARSLLDSNRPLSRSATIGSILYFVATFSDAALILVPTFIIYSLLVSLTFSE